MVSSHFVTLSVPHAHYFFEKFHLMNYAGPCCCISTRICETFHKMLKVLFSFCRILLSTWNLTVTRNGDIFAMSTVVNAPLVVCTVSDVFFWSTAMNVIQQYWKCSVVIVAVDVTNFHSDITKNINDCEYVLCLQFQIPVCYFKKRKITVWCNGKMI